MPIKAHLSSKTPRLEIYPTRIRENTEAVLRQCAQHGLEVACVTKVASAHPAVVRAFLDGGATMLADSRTENLRAIREMGVKVPLMLLRLPSISRAAETVEVADISLVSSLDTMRALSDAAKLRGRKHKAIVMVDVGDLREGVWPENLISVLKAGKELSHLEIAGLGCNLACFGGVIPSTENTGMLATLREKARRETGLELPYLSGGNSSGLPLMMEGRLPKEINHFRVGEAIVLGRNVIDRSPWPCTRQDTFVAVAEIIEIEKKASVPIGPRGQDAFGNTEEFPERGMRRRAICAIGRQDVNVGGIEPLDAGIEVLGGSSDHLILDIEECERPLKVGDEVAFYPGYGALLALSTSPYVTKQVVF
jgi:predicted amino acid racemase